MLDSSAGSSVGFICGAMLASSVLYPVRTLEASIATNELVYVSLSEHRAFIHHYQALSSVRTTL